MIALKEEKIGIIGAGLIGRAWAMVFARAGHAVALYDANPGATRDALAAMEAERRAAQPADKLGACQAWRDWRLAALMAHKREREKKRD
jgi:3-hydroxyacyl-CoA dehydrogenase